MTQRNRFFIPREDKLLGERYQLLEQLGDGSYGTRQSGITPQCRRHLLDGKSSTTTRVVCD